MTAEETAWQAAESAAAVLAPDADVLATVDAAGLGSSTFAVMRRAAAKPAATAVRGDALLDQHGDGRAGRRGPLDGDGRAAAGSGPGGR